MATDAAGNRSETDGPYRPGTPTFGPNTWLVEDMYDRYRADPESVSPSWREFFADYRVDGAGPVAVSSAVATEEAAPGVAESDGRRPSAAPAAAVPDIGQPTA
ncbi:MAG: hypothetical protein WB565_17840, partial [Acidimicrobiales bacterium]